MKKLFANFVCSGLSFGTFLLLGTLHSCSGRMERSDDVVWETLPDDIYEYEDDFDQFFIPYRDSIYICYGTDLHFMHRWQYSELYSDYEMFKSDILSKKLEAPLSTCDSTGRVVYFYDVAFKKDKKVLSLYETKGLDAVIKKYCVVGQGKLKFKDSQLSKFDANGTVAYCLWLNGYEYVYGCFTDEYLVLDGEYSVAGK